MSGWQRDEDGWYWRKSRVGDPSLRDRPDLGFDDSCFSSPPQGRVYVRDLEIAEAVNRKKLPQNILSPALSAKAPQ